MEIREITNKQEWESFLSGCPQKTFLQSWSWGDFNEIMGRKSWRLGVFNSGRQIAGALVNKIGAKRGTFLFVPHGPATIEGLTQADKKEIIELLVLHLSSFAKDEKADFVRFSPIWPRTKENVSLFEELGFIKAPIHMHPETSWKLDITLPEDQLLKNMRKTTRYLIRQAEKNPDIQIEITANASALDDFQSVYSETGKRQRFTIYRKEYTKSEFDCFAKDGQAKLFLGKYKGEVVSAAMFIFWQGECFYHHSGSLLKYSKMPVSYLLQWRAIQEAKRLGCSVYNFWGIAPDIKEESDAKKSKHPWAGLSLFKMGFGGYKEDYVEARDFILSSKYWLNYIIEKIRKLKRGL